MTMIWAAVGKLKGSGSLTASPSRFRQNSTSRFDVWISVNDDVSVIQIQFSRSFDEQTLGYRIVRSLVRYPTKEDSVIIDTPQIPHQNPLRIWGETLRRLSTNTFQFYHRHLLDWTIYIDDQPLDQTFYTVSVDQDKGRLHITPAPDGSVTADYRFDGVRTFDHPDIYRHPEEKYFGPPPEFQFSPPESLDLIWDSVNHRVLLTFAAPIFGQSFVHYGMYSYSDEGKESALSIVRSIALDQFIGDEPYQIEEGLDDVWTPVLQTGIYTNPLPMADRYGPYPPPELNIILGGEQAPEYDYDIYADLHWQASPGDQTKLTPKYRVRIQCGDMSSLASEEVGPILFSGEVTGYKIIREIYSETPPEPSPENTIAVVDADTLVYRDEEIHDHTIYHYGVFAVDQAGNLSEPVYQVETVGEIVQPGPVTNLHAQIMQL